MMKKILAFFLFTLALSSGVLLATEDRFDPRGPDIELLSRVCNPVKLANSLMDGSLLLDYEGYACFVLDTDMGNIYVVDSLEVWTKSVLESSRADLARETNPEKRWDLINQIKNLEASVMVLKDIAPSLENVTSSSLSFAPSYN